MAEIVTRTRVDDLDGSTEDIERVSFGLHGKNYVIDLNPEHVKELDKALAPFVEKASPAGSSSASAPRKSRSTSAASSEDLSAIRTWAKENDVEYRNASGEMTTVGDRGRIPQEVKDAYYAAH